MCGITGLFGKGSSLDTIKAMMAISARRGPEHTQITGIENGWLGHALLAFVAEGANPQPYEYQGQLLTWNGEIYNWQVLNERFDLQAENDTQVLLKGLVQMGDAFLHHIEGQFAYILISNEGSEPVISVGRDRWGISPLVYGVNEADQLGIASTTESLSANGFRNIKTVPAGCHGVFKNNDIQLQYWFKLNLNKSGVNKALCIEKVFEKAKRQVEIRIPDNSDILFTTMGGIDSQSVTVMTALATKGKFGGAVTVVPWDPQDPDNHTLGDYYEAKASIDMLASQGIKVPHYVAQLNPEYILSEYQGRNALDRVLSVLGPDFFNVCCGLAEDLVATIVRKNAGKAIMTAGGPDEAGWSYKPWSLRHKADLEYGFYAIGDQFASSEGVRAGLVFGEQGIENRVPFAHLIEDALQAPADQKHQITDWGDGIDPMSIEMKDKIFWRQAVGRMLPDRSMNKPKETIHGATGAKAAIHHIAMNDKAYQSERHTFIEQVMEFGWQGSIFADLNHLDVNNMLSEGQLYCLWRWQKVNIEEFSKSGNERYGNRFYSEQIDVKASRPLCYDWMTVEPL
ncbi:hypothetical protein [Pseudoalteromonas sp. S16_S37]|uniref:hypothetical protein n=1 Tax=Pseudoalteromonas sp. S16_S37 TaxID=2720228 RepID=UPI001681502E|nr:hypothetical protein [Pseudoalteromonas sp. S16_S37]MBD1584450.1 hypothetical protein [Pseudoalteromonas sp. S16_S37]